MAVIHENRPDHYRDFISLNEAWILRDFALEETDRRLSEHPGGVVDEGGIILTAVVGVRVVGACALFRKDERTFELARMAVDSAHQGEGIGRNLAETAIRRACELGAHRLTLLTNTTLNPAVELYRSLGFVVIQRGQHPEYSRCNLVMEMKLAGHT